MVKQKPSWYLEPETIRKFEKLARQEGFEGKGLVRQFIEKLTTEEFFFKDQNMIKFLNSHDLIIEEPK